MPDAFNVATSPNPTGINAPTSGTYGESAALDRLKASLPSIPKQPADTPAMAPPPPLPAGPSTAPAPAGLPAGLLAPSSRPSVPVSTPLDMGQPNPVAAAPDDRSRRLAILDALSHDPTASETTRQWAATCVKKLIASSAS